MRRRMLLLCSVALALAVAGCRHHCHKHKDGCCGDGTLPPPPIGMRGPTTLPPTTLPTQPGPSGFLQPPVVPSPAPNGNGPMVLTPDPLPGGGMSRPVQPNGPSFLGGPVKPTVEPPKASVIGIPGFTKVKDGAYAGRKPAIEGYDSLRAAGVRAVIYLHAPGADVSAVKGIVTDRAMTFVPIEVSPETLAAASARFNEVLGARLNRPAYVFADDDLRAGAVWYLHLLKVDSADKEAALICANKLGLNDQSEEGKAYWVAINKILAK